MKINISKYLKNGEARKVHIDINSHDVFSLDNTLAYIIYPALLKYKECKHGHPANMTDKQWDEIIDEMAQAFRMIRDEEDYSFNNDYEEVQKKIKKGLKLFAKHYQHLWY